jgi:glycosyltransferase involved in cell wall biosynthesis
MKKIKKWLFLNLLKITGMHKRCHFHATDVVERKYIEQIFEKTSSVTIAGNYATVYNAEKNKHKNKGELKLITIALVSPMKNHLIVLKALKECKGLIEYHIIGSIKDQAYWEKCLEVMKQIPDNIKVTYHGEIPPNQISRFFIDSPVLILPSESESYGHSIFEALSAGIPVITSGNTPWNELQENNAGININPNVHEIKESINYYLSLDNQEYDASSLAAVAYLKKKYNERDLFEEYKALLLN